MITIKCNNQATNVDAGCTLAVFLKNHGYEDNGFAVAINHKFVPSSRFAVTKLQQDDSVEIIRPMQGG